MLEVMNLETLRIRGRHPDHLRAHTTRFERAIQACAGRERGSCLAPPALHEIRFRMSRTVLARRVDRPGEPLPIGSDQDRGDGARGSGAGVRVSRHSVRQFANQVHGLCIAEGERSGLRKGGCLWERGGRDLVPMATRKYIRGRRERPDALGCHAHKCSFQLGHRVGGPNGQPNHAEGLRAQSVPKT